MNDKLVERVARAIVKRNYPSFNERDADVMWEGFVPDAEAAIEAAGVADLVEALRTVRDNNRKGVIGEEARKGWARANAVLAMIEGDA